VEGIIKGGLASEAIFKKNCEYIARVHSFGKFETTIQDILLTNKYDDGFTINPNYKI